MATGDGSTTPLALPRRDPSSRGPIGRVTYAVWDFTKKKPIGALSALVIVLLVILAVIGPSIAPYDPRAGNAARALQGPSLETPLGADHIGRDMLSRLLYGAQASVRVSLGAVLIGSVFGVLLGTVSGYIEGVFDAVIQRFVDALMAVPLIIIAIMLISLTSPTLNNLIIALSIAIIPRASRVARGSTLAVKHEVYIDAANAIGATHTRIIRSHILPNIFAPIIVLFSVTMGGAITAEAALSFLGLGPPALISWGGMLSSEGRQYMRIAWWMAVFPGLAIMFTVLAFNMLGDALRDVLDPRLRGSR